jgi:hypothetical protein
MGEASLLPQAVKPVPEDANRSTVGLGENLMAGICF